MRLNVVLNGRLLTALVMLAIFVSMTLIALGLPPQARLMPLMVGVPGSILALVQVLRDLRAAIDESQESDRKVPDESDAEWGMFFWTILFFAGILAFGFLYASPVLVFGFLRIGRQESMKVGLIGAACTWTVLELFERWLEIQLFTGLVVEWLLS